MPVTVPAHDHRAVSGRPAVPPTMRTLAERMVAHFIEGLGADRQGGGLPGDIVRAAVPVVTAHFLECAATVLDRRPVPARFPHLDQAAGRWARAEVPLDTVLHAAHAGFRIGVELLSKPMPGHRSTTVHRTDIDDLAERMTLIVDLLDRTTTTITLAYVRETRAMAEQYRGPAHTLASALLGGHANSALARQCGIEIASRYAVLAVHIPHPADTTSSVAAEVNARRALRRVRSELADRCRGRALALLSVDGGTILLPEPDFAAGDLEPLVAKLSEAGRVPVTAAAISALSADIPAASEDVHRLLDSVTRLGYPAGVYRHDHVALEVQLSRPGPARDSLVALLDPLASHPDLITLLCAHLGNNLNRQVTARQFHIHTNTVDNRLKRVAYLTGLDPATGDGAWMLRSALIACGRSVGEPEAAPGISAAARHSA